MVRPDARLVLASDARILSASPAALDLLGLTLDELQALPPGSMTLEEDRDQDGAFGQAWEGGGRAPILGSATARLPSGRMIRLRYLIQVLETGNFEVVLEASPESIAKPSRMYTVGSVLSAWRAAQRRLEVLEVGSLEWTSAQEDSEKFRAEYRRLSGERPQAAGPDSS